MVMELVYLHYTIKSDGKGFYVKSDKIIIKSVSNHNDFYKKSIYI
jgi:hypothetical protein